MKLPEHTWSKSEWISKLSYFETLAGMLVD